MSAPLTVLVLIDELEEWRGAETHLHRLLTGIDPARIRPVVGIVGRRALAPAFREAGVATHELEIPKVFAASGLRGLKRIAGLIRREGAGLLVSYHTASDLLGPPAARLAGIPALSSRRDMGFTKKPIHVRVQRPLNRLVRGIICVSHAVAQAVEATEGYSRSRIQVIWNGENMQRFCPGDSTVREALGIPQTACVLTCVGGLDPVKDHATLLRAFARVAARHPHCVLLLAGRGPEQEALARQAESLGDRVRFLGHRGDIPDLLRASDIYVQTSRTEGFSNAILQAMGAALPVVVTRVGGNPEFVRDDAGLLVEPGDADATAAALERLMTDAALRQTFGAAARRRAETHGSIASMCETYADAFERAVSGRFPGPSP